ncbi:hypothetical protein L7F22_030988 [Adiantum nelumboides]|nr:hypothetical protein [Adiantum nelumboides]
MACCKGGMVVVGNDSPSVSGGGLGRDVGLGKAKCYVGRKKGRGGGANVGTMMDGSGGNYYEGMRHNNGMYDGISNGGGFMLMRMGKPITMMKRRSKRLSGEQVRALEKAFKESNKLGLERKGKLARELNLQARQIAVWFQNRRARCKTKQMENDYDGLKHHLDSLTAQRDQLLQDKERLQAQVSSLQHQLNARENTGDSAMSSPNIPQESEHLESSSAVSMIEDDNLEWNVPITWITSSSLSTMPIPCATTSSNIIDDASAIILDEDFFFYHQNSLI